MKKLPLIAKCIVPCIILTTLFSCKNKPSTEETESKKIQKILEAKENAITDYVQSLSTEAKISQLFLVNIEGNEKYHSVEKKDGKNIVPGGVLLFSYNISNDPLETYEYIKSIRDFYLKNNNPPPYIAVDQEGGYVNRLRSLTSALWAQKKVADSFTLENAEKLYSAQARQMKNLGFHLNLAPVIEVETEENKDFLDTRSFGELEKVLTFGKIEVQSYEKNGISTVLKHFPGNSNSDPHIGLPKITFTEENKDLYFKPFEEILPEASAVLMSHAIVEEKNSENKENTDMPACFSEHWIQNIIKNEYKFSGLIISDDIFMGALSKNGFPPEIAAVKAIEAGVDIIMLSEKKFWNVAEILLKKASEDKNFEDELMRAVKNVIRFKIKTGILEMTEIDAVSTDASPSEKKDGAKGVEAEVPVFSIQISANYAEFDLKQFDEDYKSGMDAYNP